jgi:hypothetical protein
MIPVIKAIGATLPFVDEKREVDLLALFRYNQTDVIVH